MYVIQFHEWLPNSELPKLLSHICCVVSVTSPDHKSEVRPKLVITSCLTVDFKFHLQVRIKPLPRSSSVLNVTSNSNAVTHFVWFMPHIRRQKCFENIGVKNGIKHTSQKCAHLSKWSLLKKVRNCKVVAFFGLRKEAILILEAVKSHVRKSDCGHTRVWRTSDTGSIRDTRRQRSKASLSPLTLSYPVPNWSRSPYGESLFSSLAVSILNVSIGKWGPS